MVAWQQFARAEPELAQFGAERLAGGVAYLATVRGDSLPRVHPVTPIIGGGRLFIFMEPASPKGRDLHRDGRYALHSAVGDTAGTGGEFIVRGHAAPVDAPALRTAAVEAASYSPADRYILFEFGVEEAVATVYEGGLPVRRRWQAG